MAFHDDVIKWKHFPRHWPFVQGIHRSRWIPRTKASDAELWWFLICARINDWVNNREAGDLRRHRGHYDVSVMSRNYIDPDKSFIILLDQTLGQFYQNEVICFPWHGPWNHHLQILHHLGDMGVSKLIFPLDYFLCFSASSKHWLPIRYHIHIWHVSPQLSCQYERDLTYTYTYSKSNFHITWNWTNRSWVTPILWWRHQIETFSALLAICAGNSPVPGEFPAQRPVTRSFDVFFDLRLNKRLSKQWWGWWFETLSRPLWRHCNTYYSCLRSWHNTFHI